MKLLESLRLNPIYQFLKSIGTIPQATYLVVFLVIFGGILVNVSHDYDVFMYEPYLWYFPLLKNYLNEVNEYIQNGHRPLHLVIWSIPNNSQFWRSTILPHSWWGIINGKNGYKVNALLKVGLMRRDIKVSLVQGFCSYRKRQKINSTKDACLQMEIIRRIKTWIYYHDCATIIFENKLWHVNKQQPSQNKVLSIYINIYRWIDGYRYMHQYFVLQHEFGLKGKFKEYIVYNFSILNFIYHIIFSIISFLI